MTPLSVGAFRTICARHPYRNKSLFYNEVYLFLRACGLKDVDCLIESGRLYGNTTRLLVDAFKGEVVSIDRQDVSGPIPGATMIHGEAADEVAKAIFARPKARIGLLMDGPKGALALAIKNAVLSGDGPVQVVAIHDAPMGQGENQHSHETAIGLGLNDLITTDYATKYPKGPGLALWWRQ